MEVRVQRGSGRSVSHDDSFPDGDRAQGADARFANIGGFRPGCCGGETEVRVKGGRRVRSTRNSTMGPRRKEHGAGTIGSGRTTGPDGPRFPEGPSGRRVGATIDVGGAAQAGRARGEGGDATRAEVDERARAAVSRGRSRRPVVAARSERQGYRPRDRHQGAEQQRVARVQGAGRANSKAGTRTSKGPTPMAGAAAETASTKAVVTSARDLPGYRSGGFGESPKRPAAKIWPGPSPRAASTGAHRVGDLSSPL